MASKQIEKMRETMLRKYGVDNAGKIPQFVEKQKQTCQEKYGGNSPACDPKVVEKMKQTCLEKYGYEFATLLPHVREKALSEFMKLCEDPKFRNQCKEMLEKARIEKFGTSNLMSIKEFRDSALESFFKKYGIVANFSRPEVRAKAHKTILEKYGVDYPMQSLEVRSRSKKYPNKQEKQIVELFPELQLNFNFRVKVAKRKFKFPDFLVSSFPESNKIVEFFGNYWHSKLKTGLDEKEHEALLKEQYKSVGLDCFVIWYHQLKDIEKLRADLNKFIQTPVETECSSSPEKDEVTVQPI